VPIKTVAQHEVKRLELLSPDGTLDESGLAEWLRRVTVALPEDWMRDR
jgi:hypothetical protein